MSSIHRALRDGLTIMFCRTAKLAKDFEMAIRKGNFFKSDSPSGSLAERGNL